MHFLICVKMIAVEQITQSLNVLEVSRVFRQLHRSGFASMTFTARQKGEVNDVKPTTIDRLSWDFAFRWCPLNHAARLIAYFSVPPRLTAISCKFTSFLIKRRFMCSRGIAASTRRTAYLPAEHNSRRACGCSPSSTCPHRSP